MLDLDPTVDFDEVGLALGIDKELEGSDVFVARRDNRADGPLAQLGTSCRAEGGCGTFLENLLMAALDGAVALPELHAVTIAIDGDLDLDVAGVVKPFLEVEGIVTECRFRLGSADPERRFELSRGSNHAHALAAATGRGLDENRVADPLRLDQRMLIVADHPDRPGDRREAIAPEEAACPLLARETIENLGRRADERQVMGADNLGEGLVLGQESVARVDGIAARDDRSRDDRRHR